MRNSKSTSIHSIYQNALPFYHDRADLAHADESGKSFAATFIQELLSGSLSRQLDADNVSADKIRHIYFEARNYEKTAGPKTFGFGYPLLVDAYEGELLVAPLFIWQLAIEPAQAKVDAWVLKFDQSGHITPNYQVVERLKDKFDLDWKEKMEELSSPDKMSAAKLDALCQELVERLQLDTADDEGGIRLTPGIDMIGDLTENGTLHRSGVLGLYPPQYVFHKDEEKPEDIFVSQKIEPEEKGMVFPFSPADPEQLTALETTATNSMACIEGIDALGKTQTVLNLLVNALANGEKCLVVSERAQALKKTQELLSRSGINQLHFLLDDAQNDKTQMLELLRVLAGGASISPPDFDGANFEKKKKKFVAASANVSSAYQAVKRKIFNGYNWTDTVGLYLASQKIEGKELLATHLQAADFEFTEKEHHGLKSDIERCKPSFARVGTLKHPLTVLHHRFFSGGDVAEEELQKVEKLSLKYLQDGKRLHRKYLNETDNYVASLKQHYRTQYDRLEKMLSEIEAKINTYKNELGSAFEEAGSGGLKLGLLFSAKKKKVARAQKDIAKDYHGLIRDYEENRPFEFEPVPDKGGLHIAKLRENLRIFREALNRWRDRTESIVQEEANRLNSKTAHPALGVKEQITGLEYSLELYIEELNDSGLLEKPFENKTLTIPQRQKYLESIIEKLEATQLALRDFTDFHQWQTNWLALSPLAKKVVKSLIKVRPENWLAAFESWYFHTLLSLSENDALPKNTEILEEYASAWHEVKPLIINKITSCWKTRQTDSLRKLKRKEKRTFQMLFEKTGLKKSKDIGLRDILANSMEAVTDLLPILFVTPHVALSVLPAEFKFDVVVFEESNCFSVELATGIAKKGRRVAIFGSDGANGGETSLLQYALESGVPSAKITNCYEAPTLQSPMSHSAGQLFHFAHEYYVENLQGRFHEMEGTNDVEAQHIIRLLNQVKQTPQRVYPTVGVVAFTIEQRDLISSYLLKLKQQNSVGSEKIRQLERNGMGVYHPEEVFGQQFDILILSCTYGAVNLKGDLTKKLMSLNTPQGLNHMHLLINKPVQQLFILHSFPDKALHGFLGKKYDEGTWLLANFIQLAEAKINGNEAIVSESLEAIGKVELRKKSISPFSIQIKEALSPYLDSERIEFSKNEGDVVVPISVAPAHPDQPQVALLPDVFLADTSMTSGFWEHQRNTGLKELGYERLVVPSLSWFKNHESEARRLASRLIKLDAIHRPGEQEENKKGEARTNEVEDKETDL